MKVVAVLLVALLSAQRCTAFGANTVHNGIRQCSIAEKRKCSPHSSCYTNRTQHCVCYTGYSTSDGGRTCTMQPEVDPCTAAAKKEAACVSGEFCVHMGPGVNKCVASSS